MFIVWGKKVVRRRLGYAADFCSICRCASAFEVRRIGMAGHIYYVSLGEGELLGFDRTCHTCGTAVAADPKNYRAFARKPGALAPLVAETFPDLAEAWKDRIALEEKIRNTPSQLTGDERSALIREPFLRLSPKVESRFGAAHFDKETGFAALGAIVLVATLPGLAASVAPAHEGAAFLTAVALGIGLVGWQIALATRRYMQREIVPTLRRALAPLRPSAHEIGAVLAELKQHQYKIGAKLSAADLAPAAAC
jgi:hypothetical protein